MGKKYEEKIMSKTSILIGKKVRSAEKPRRKRWGKGQSRVNSEGNIWGKDTVKERDSPKT